MTKREKVLLGTSITGFTGFLITGYYMIAYKQAFDILVEEQKASYEKPFMGVRLCKTRRKRRERTCIV